MFPRSQINLNGNFNYFNVPSWRQISNTVYTNNNYEKNQWWNVYNYEDYLYITSEPEKTTQPEISTSLKTLDLENSNTSRGSVELTLERKINRKEPEYGYFNGKNNIESTIIIYLIKIIIKIV